MSNANSRIANHVDKLQKRIHEQQADINDLKVKLTTALAANLIFEIRTAKQQETIREIVEILLPVSKYASTRQVTYGDLHKIAEFVQKYGDK